MHQLTKEPALFKTKEGATQADVDKVLEFANALLAKIPVLLSVKTGKATGMAATHGQGFDWGVIATFDKPEDFAIYQKHPEHDP